MVDNKQFHVLDRHVYRVASEESLSADNKFLKVSKKPPFVKQLGGENIKLHEQVCALHLCACLMNDALCKSLCFDLDRFRVNNSVTNFDIRRINYNKKKIIHMLLHIDRFFIYY